VLVSAYGLWRGRKKAARAFETARPIVLPQLS
jgi:hypothetical protein